MEENFDWGLESGVLQAVKYAGGALPSEKKFLNKVKEKLPELSDRAWKEFKDIAREENQRRK